MIKGLQGINQDNHDHKSNLQPDKGSNLDDKSLNIELIDDSQEF